MEAIQELKQVIISAKILKDKMQVENKSDYIEELSNIISQLEKILYK